MKLLDFMKVLAFITLLSSVSENNYYILQVGCCPTVIFMEVNCCENPCILLWFYLANRFSISASLIIVGQVHVYYHGDGVNCNPGYYSLITWCNTTFCVTRPKHFRPSKYCSWVFSLCWHSQITHIYLHAWLHTIYAAKAVTHERMDACLWCELCARLFTWRICGCVPGLNHSCRMKCMHVWFGRCLFLWWESRCPLVSEWEMSVECVLPSVEWCVRYVCTSCWPLMPNATFDLDMCMINMCFSSFLFIFILLHCIFLSLYVCSRNKYYCFCWVEYNCWCAFEIVVDNGLLCWLFLLMCV